MGIGSNTHMYHYIYKILNEDNGKYYIGRRSSKCPPDVDPYMGSGKVLKQAMQKHNNFTKTILYTCETYEELVKLESDIITEDMVSDGMCYNIASGGHGGYTDYAHMKNFKHTQESKDKISKANAGRCRPDVVERNVANGFNKYWSGKKRSEEDRKKKSMAAMITNNNPFREEVVCPHCDKVGQKPNMIRWHFENCKKNS